MHPLGHGIVGISPASAVGKLYINNYPFKTPGGSLPRFTLRAKDGRWYQLFRQELYNLWGAGVEWKCDEKTEAVAEDKTVMRGLCQPREDQTARFAVVGNVSSFCVGW